jgi:hypothetical protein
LFNNIIAENFPNLEKEAYRTPDTWDKKKKETPSDIS